MTFQTRQIVVERCLFTLSAAATLVCVGLLAFLLTAILIGGWQRLDLAFLLTPMAGAGLQGGVWYQIVGTVVLISGAAVVVTPFAIALALCYACFARTAALRRVLGLGLHVVNCTPSILFGILGFVFFIKLLAWEKTWLAGSLILSLMILPTVTISLIQRIQTIPSVYLEGARGLGFEEGLLIRTVILPYSLGGLLTGLVMGLARAAGETAPIMFTAVVFAGATVPNHWADSPVVALPYHIFNLAQDVYGSGALETAWASAAVLTGVVLCVSALAVPLRIKSHEEAR